MLYGFNQEHSRTLKRIARKAGLAPTAGTKVKYPKPLADDGLTVILGKTDAQITKGNSGNVSRWEVDAAGTETDTGETDVVKNKWATIAINKWCAYVRIGGAFYMISGECPLT